MYTSSNKELIEMKKEFTVKVDMETKTTTADLLECYSLKDIQKLSNALSSRILKEEVFRHMCKELDENNLKCPHCGSTHVYKNGKTPQGVQRYKCACKKTFILRHNTLTYHSRLTLDQWSTMLCSTLNNDSLKRMAALADISITSAFYCRHKILYVLVQIMNEDILLDEAELDETYITFEQEGHVQTGKRGISDDKIGIACAIDIHGNNILSVADRGRPTSKTLIEIFETTLTKGMKIISDSQRSYHPLMKHLEVDWKKIPTRKKEIEGYKLDRVNKLHEEIKTFLRGKRNVASHYLQGYLALFQYRKKHPLYLKEQILRQSFYQLNCIKTALRNRDICSGINIYRTFYLF